MVDLDTLQAYAKVKAEQITAKAASAGIEIKPVEPSVSEVSSTGDLAIGFSEEVVAFGGDEIPDADSMIEIFQTYMIGVNAEVEALNFD